MKSFSWHSRAPTRQRIPACYDPPRAGCPSPPPPLRSGWEGGHESHLRLSPLLRRGRRITEDTRSSEESEESEEEGEGSDKPDPVAWSMPDGFTLGAEPSKLDASLVGKHIYMRWKD